MPRKKSVRKKNASGIAKIASFTATSISNAYSTYKKKQDQRKVEEIKLKKLAENNKVIQERKELRSKEDQLKKDQDKLYHLNILPLDSNKHSIPIRFHHHHSTL